MRLEQRLRDFVEEPTTIDTIAKLFRAFRETVKTEAMECSGQSWLDSASLKGGSRFLI